MQRVATSVAAMDESLPVARDLINRAEREAVVSRSEFRPWARVDTKNIEPLEADDDVQDRKQEEASRKTCRGC